VTEEDWLSACKPDVMLEHLQRHSPRFASRRKPRLFACGCCRLGWSFLTDPKARFAVEVAERFADGQATMQERDAARHALNSGVGTVADPIRPPPWNSPSSLAHATGGSGKCVWAAARQAAATLVRLRVLAALGPDPQNRPGAEWRRVRAEERVVVCELIRDLWPNPFRSLEELPKDALHWNGGTVVKMAQRIYDDRAFDDLPVLGDALQDAGVDDETILRHCRGPGPHARGCWIVDSILLLR
jgi:hypothetical protein